MTKYTLFILFLIAAIYFSVQSIFGDFLQTSPWLNQSLAMVYAWSPGLIGLYFAKKEGVSLPIFTKFNKWFFLIPLVAILAAAFGLLASIPFGGAQVVNPQFAGRSIGGIIGFSILFFIIGFFFFSILIGFVFLGGELYWRGYFWEKVKQKGPLKMIFLTALLWSLYQLPASYLTNRVLGFPFLFTLLSVLGVNFVLSPVLTFFRVKTGNVMGAAYTFSALTGAFIFFLILFPSGDLRTVAIMGGFTLVGLILFSLIYKLYVPASWKKLV